MRWLNAENLSDEEGLEKALSDVQGVLIPGGYGERGTRGKMRAIRYARENNLPFFGICLGMQLAVVEYARNVLGLQGAHSSELNSETPHPVVGLMTQWDKEGQKIERTCDEDLGGTMRLGAYPCVLTEGSLAHKVYGAKEIIERHRHRYEVNSAYREQFEAAGLRVTGLSPDGTLPEIVEIEGHPWFLAMQFHPEFKSKPMAPHPVFTAFIAAANNHKDNVKD